MHNKRVISIFLFFLFPILSWSQRKNCMLEVRDSIVKEIELLESTKVDKIAFFYSFDSLMKACKIDAIYLEDNGTNASHYLPGAILINKKSKYLLVDKLTSELAHAKQFAERPIFYAKEAIGAVLNAFTRSVLHRKRYKLEADKLMNSTDCFWIVAYTWVAYREEHKNPESYEYEAHEIIEPELRRILWRHACQEKELYYTYEILQ